MGSIPGFPALPTAIRTGRGFHAHGMEAWNQADRTAFPATEAVPMKGICANNLALRLNRARLHSSRRRVLVAPGFGTAANQRKSPDRLGLADQFAPSSPRPDTRLRAEQIGGLFSPAQEDILYQSPAIATGFRYQANVIACCQLFGSLVQCPVNIIA